MSATILVFPRGRAVRPAQPAHRGEIIPFPPVRCGLTRWDLNAIEGIMAKSHGGWHLEVEPSEAGPSALILPTISGRGDVRAFMVCRDGKRLRLLDARPAVDWPTLGSFDSLEALLDALARAIGAFAAA